MSIERRKNLFHGTKELASFCFEMATCGTRIAHDIGSLYYRNKEISVGSLVIVSNLNREKKYLHQIGYTTGVVTGFTGGPVWTRWNVLVDGSIQTFDGDEITPVEEYNYKYEAEVESEEWCSKPRDRTSLRASKRSSRPSRGPTWRNFFKGLKRNLGQS